jgi:hypothetical protein
MQDWVEPSRARTSIRLNFWPCKFKAGKGMLVHHFYTFIFLFFLLLLLLFFLDLALVAGLLL